MSKMLIDNIKDKEIIQTLATGD